MKENRTKECMIDTKCSAKSCKDAKKKFFAFCLRLIKIEKTQWKQNKRVRDLLKQ